MNKTKAWRLSLVAIFTFGWLLTIPTNAYAACVNYLQSQTIAAAYTGDEEPTVHEMDTCSGDDISYQIPIASTITFDGVEYDTIYATTNSVITFGRPDNTYWTYPSTPSISLYSMDWYAGINNAPNGLDIYYSEGGFQLNLQAIPFGNWQAQPSNINILVAITNTGQLAISYSYEGPQYQNLRTGVRLHNGDIVSLEEFGATQVQAGEPLPSLSAEPLPEPTPTPTGPTAEEIALIEEIRQISALIAALSIESPSPLPTPSVTASDGSTATITPTPTPIEPTPDTSETPQEPNTDPIEPSPVPTLTPTPEPSVSPSESVLDPSDDVIEVEPEIITPEDPRFPDPETLPEPEPVPDSLINIIANLTNKDNLLSLTPEQKFVLATSLGIKTEEIQLVAQIAKENTNVAEALSTFENRAAENKDASMPYTLADATTEVQAEKFLENPISFLTDINLEELLSPSDWGKDMTDDQREKAQEVVIPVIIASNIVAAAMTRRK